MDPDVILQRIEFEYARLRRVLSKHHQALWRNDSITAAQLLSEARLIRDELDELEELYTVA